MIPVDSDPEPRPQAAVPVSLGCHCSHADSLSVDFRGVLYEAGNVDSISKSKIQSKLVTVKRKAEISS